jgi:hypothetical protein
MRTEVEMSQVDMCNAAANMGMETDPEYAGRVNSTCILPE